MAELGIVVGVLVVLDVVALLFGLDSRDGNDWMNHGRRIRS